MELPVVSALEFDQVRSSIKNFVKNKTDFEDYDFDGSNLSMLVDILSYNTLFTTYNLNMSVNELNLDTAVLRDNIVSIAKRLGYTPNSYTSSKVKINVFVDGLGKNYDYVRFDRGSVLTTSYNNKNYSFILRDKVEINAKNKDSVVFTDLELSEGSEFAITYVVDESNEHQRFYIPNNFIDSNSIRVFVISDPTNNVEIEYERKTTIVDVGTSDEVFFVEEIQDQKYEVIFGDDVIGRKVRNGEIIKIQYLITNGGEANNINTFKFVGKIRGITETADGLIPYTDVSWSLASEKSDGGSSFETARSIKYRAPRYYASQERAVTVSDYESLIQQIYPNTDLVRVIGGENLSPPRYGKVFIVIKPLVGNTISNGEKDRISRELIKYKVGSVDTDIGDYKKYGVVTKPVIAYDTAKTRNRQSDLDSKVNEVISEYIKDPDFNQFGGKYSDLELRSRLKNIDPAIEDVGIITYLKKPINLVPGVETNYKTDFNTKLKTNSNDKYYVMSEPFCHRGISEPVFLGTPTSRTEDCDIDNTIYLITTDGTVIKPVGTVDAETGELDYTIQPCEDGTGPGTGTGPGDSGGTGDLDDGPGDINIVVIPEVLEITVGPEDVPTLDLDDILIFPDADDPNNIDALDPDGPYLDPDQLLSDPPPGDSSIVGPGGGSFDPNNLTTTGPDDLPFNIIDGPGGGIVDLPVIPPGTPGTQITQDPVISDPNDINNIEDYVPETDPYSCS